GETAARPLAPAGRPRPAPRCPSSSRASPRGCRSSCTLRDTSTPCRTFADATRARNPPSARRARAPRPIAAPRPRWRPRARRAGCASRCPTQAAPPARPGRGVWRPAGARSSAPKPPSAAGEKRLHDAFALALFLALVERLVLEAHGVRHALHLLARDRLRSLANQLLQRLAIVRHQRVHHAAVEALRQALQALQRDRFPRFA